MAKSQSQKVGKVIQIKFDDNNLARSLFGPQETHMKSLEDRLGVDIHVRGGEVSIKGGHEQIQLVQKLLQEMYGLLKKGHPILGSDIENAVRLIANDQSVSINEIFAESIFIPSRKKLIYPRSEGQRRYVQVLKQYDLIFGVGPAGTGKTYLAMAMAVTSLLKGSVKRIILTRPAIEAGEKLGFLPGNLIEKVNPYLRPLYDALHDMLDFDKTQRMLDRGDIEVAPLAFMRGRTLNDAYVILDEAQNCTREQMKMFLTRIGFYSKAVITGDVTQIDLPRDTTSGLVHALQILKRIPRIAMHFMSDTDVVRHPLVQEIIRAYADEDDGAKH